MGRFGECGELDLHGHSLITAHTVDIGLPVANRHAFDLEKLVQGFKSSPILDEIPIPYTRPLVVEPSPLSAGEGPPH